MQITLNETEIKQAIIAFVGNQGISITGKNVDVTLVAGRAPNGMSAAIDISNDVAESPAPHGKTVIEIESKDAPPVSGLNFNEAVNTEDANTTSEEEKKPLFGQ